MFDDHSLDRIEIPDGAYANVIERAKRKRRQRAARTAFGSTATLITLAITLATVFSTGGNHRPVQVGSGPVGTISNLSTTSSPETTLMTSPTSSIPPSSIASLPPATDVRTVGPVTTEPKARTTVPVTQASPTPSTTTRTSSVIVCPTSPPESYPVGPDPTGVIAPAGAENGAVCYYSFGEPSGGPPPTSQHEIYSNVLNNIIAGLNASTSPTSNGNSNVSAGCPPFQQIFVIILHYSSGNYLAFNDGGVNCESLSRIKSTPTSPSTEWWASAQLQNQLDQMAD